jgi:acetyl-CoA synthetase
MFGQTEINYIVGRLRRRPTLAAAAGPRSPAAWAWRHPGHQRGGDRRGRTHAAVGMPGDVARAPAGCARPAAYPVFFLGYWQNQAATQRREYRDRRPGAAPAIWPRWTMPTATCWYQGRGDDVFKAAGYRIGPGEIENCLVKHPAVAQRRRGAQARRRERGALVKAYVVLAPEFIATRSSGARASPIRCPIGARPAGPCARQAGA